jgi:hypothetical protein
MFRPPFAEIPFHELVAHRGQDTPDMLIEPRVTVAFKHGVQLVLYVGQGLEMALPIHLALLSRVPFLSLAPFLNLVPMELLQRLRPLFMGQCANNWSFLDLRFIAFSYWISLLIMIFTRCRSHGDADTPAVANSARRGLRCTRDLCHRHSSRRLPVAAPC